jgi:hypothetical protein
LQFFLFILFGIPAGRKRIEKPKKTGISEDVIWSDVKNKSQIPRIEYVFSMQNIKATLEIKCKFYIRAIVSLKPSLFFARSRQKIIA